jgi:hypothetical protein
VPIFILLFTLSHRGNGNGKLQIKEASERVYRVEAFKTNYFAVTESDLCVKEMKFSILSNPPMMMMRTLFSGSFGEVNWNQ